VTLAGNGAKHEVITEKGEEKEGGGGDKKENGKK
jgi:hypothetical protein